MDRSSQLARFASGWWLAYALVAFSWTCGGPFPAAVVAIVLSTAGISLTRGLIAMVLGLMPATPVAALPNWGGWLAAPLWALGSGSRRRHARVPPSPSARRPFHTNQERTNTMTARQLATWAGFCAALATGGLAIAHLAVYTAGFLHTPEATWQQYLLGGVAISIGAAAFAAVALALVRTSPRRKVPIGLLVAAWFGCAVFTLQAVLIAASGDLSLFGPARPGTYSAIAGPAFGVLAWCARLSRPERTRQALS